MVQLLQLGKVRVCRRLSQMLLGAVFKSHHEMLFRKLLLLAQLDRGSSPVYVPDAGSVAADGQVIGFDCSDSSIDQPFELEDDFRYVMVVEERGEAPARELGFLDRQQ